MLLRPSLRGLASPLVRRPIVKATMPLKARIMSTTAATSSEVGFAVLPRVKLLPLTDYADANSNHTSRATW